MTRPIKFRAKLKDSNELVYFPLNAESIEVNVASEVGFLAENRDGSTYQPGHRKEGLVQLWEVDWETLEQFTGLTDKNRKEVYEGDIVRVIEDKYNGNLDGDEFEVKFEGGMFMPFGWKDEGDLVVEVIGNKCENPELLEAK